MAKEYERDRLIFDLINQRHSQEWQRINDLDGKATNIIGFVSAITGFLLGTLSLGLEEFKMLSIPLISTFFAGIMFLFIAIVFALLALRVRKWQLVPNVITLVQNYPSKPIYEALARISGEMAKVTKELEDKNNSKAKDIQVAWISTMIGLFIIFIYSIVLFL